MGTDLTIKDMSETQEVDDSETILNEIPVKEIPDYTQQDLDDFINGKIDINVPELPEGITSFTDLPPLHTMVNLLPEKVRKQLKNIQGLSTKKAQEASEWRNKYESLEKELEYYKQTTLQSYQGLNQKLTEPDISEEEMLSSPEGMKKWMAQQVLKIQAETLKPAYESFQKQIQEQELKKQQEKSIEWIRSKPEFRDQGFIEQVATLTDRGMLLEDAYDLVKFKNFQQAEKLQQQQARDNKSFANRQALSLTGTGVSKDRFVPDLTGMSLAERYKATEAYFKQYGKLPPKQR